MPTTRLVETLEMWHTLRLVLLAGFVASQRFPQRVVWVGRDAELGRVGAVRWGTGRTVADRGRSIISMSNQFFTLHTKLTTC